MRKLIVIEGLPCSGKSTAAKNIADKLGMKYFDEGSGNHPADYEFHAFINREQLSQLRADEQTAVASCSEKKGDGFIVPLEKFSGELFDKLLHYKIYDFLPWETEKPLMLDKWREFTEKALSSAGSCVFNCVFLQNPMCETMMRFGFDTEASQAYIREIYDIIRPLKPFVVYLRTSDIRKEIEAAIPERGSEWLTGVIDYHCGGEYGKSKGLSGFDGYISALEERQRRELMILESLGIDYTVVDDIKSHSSEACDSIISNLA
ncbi:MAG: hypothetical protein J6Y64_09025 [Ruminococcus sp.]|nr:hypothetical protein [Ruminococcus sp.]